MEWTSSWTVIRYSTCARYSRSARVNNKDTLCSCYSLWFHAVGSAGKHTVGQSDNVIEIPQYIYFAIISHDCCHIFPCLHSITNILCTIHFMTIISHIIELSVYCTYDLTRSFSMLNPYKGPLTVNTGGCLVQTVVYIVDHSTYHYWQYSVSQLKLRLYCTIVYMLLYDNNNQIFLSN